MSHCSPEELEGSRVMGVGEQQCLGQRRAVRFLSFEPCFHPRLPDFPGRQQYGPGFPPFSHAICGRSNIQRLAECRLALLRSQSLLEGIEGHSLFLRHRLLPAQSKQEPTTLAAILCHLGQGGALGGYWCLIFNGGTQNASWTWLFPGV